VVGHIEVGHQEGKEREIAALREQMDKMGDVRLKLDPSLKYYRDEFMSYVRKLDNRINLQISRFLC